jgi:hypothetical protein
MGHQTLLSCGGPSSGWRWPSCAADTMYTVGWDGLARPQVKAEPEPEPEIHDLCQVSGSLPRMRTCAHEQHQRLLAIWLVALDFQLVITINRL